MTRLCQFIIILLTVTLLSSCGFTLRSRNNLPAPLTSIYISMPPSYYGSLSENINVFFTSMKIKTVNASSPSILTLAFTNIEFNATTDTLSSSSNAMNTTYQLKLNVQLLNHHQQAVSEKHTISIQKSQQQNTNQIISHPKELLYQNEMNRDAINAMYQWLASDSITKDINNYYKKRSHATPHQTA